MAGTGRPRRELECSVDEDEDVDGMPALDPLDWSSEDESDTEAADADESSVKFRNAGISSSKLSEVVNQFEGLWPKAVIVHGKARHSESQGFIAIQRTLNVATWSASVWCYFHLLTTTVLRSV